MSLGRDDQPVLLIIGGPNGSGKSSAYHDSRIEEDGRYFRIINPDLFAARIARMERLEPEAANLEAVNRIAAWLETSILAGHTVGVETVLSTDKYRPLVTRAKALNYAFWLIYVILDTPERNVERVRLRVRRGGHAVPENKIVDRYSRSLQQLPWFLEQADRALIYDNSGAAPRRIGEKTNGILTISDVAPPALAASVKSLGEEAR